MRTKHALVTVLAMLVSGAMVASVTASPSSSSTLPPWGKGQGFAATAARDGRRPRQPRSDLAGVGSWTGRSVVRRPVG